MLVLAVLLAALIEPAVNWLHRRKIPRALSVVGLYIIIFTILIVSLILIIPPFVEQVSQLAANFSDISGSISPINRPDQSFWSGIWLVARRDRQSAKFARRR